MFLKYTSPPWTQPVPIYLLERVDGDKVWLACRPALDLEQETLPRFQLQGEEEYICFEHVDFTKLETGDDAYLLWSNMIVRDHVRPPHPQGRKPVYAGQYAGALSGRDASSSSANRSQPRNWRCSDACDAAGSQCSEQRHGEDPRGDPGHENAGERHGDAAHKAGDACGEAEGSAESDGFFGEGDSEEDEYFEPPLPIQPPNPVRKGGLRIGEVRVRMAM